MLVLTNINQINERINNLFNLENGFSKDDFSFVNEVLPEGTILSLVKDSKIEGKEKELEELSLLIFQLKDYIPALCNFTNFLLLSKNYIPVYDFTTKLFISHVGTINYNSHGFYSFKERYFDRFVEIIKNCNISKENYFPFLISIFKNQTPNKLENWKGPCLEFLQTFYNENQDFFLNYISSGENRFVVLFLLSRFNTQKALSLSFDYLSVNQPQEEILEILKGIKKDTLQHIDKSLASASELYIEKFYVVLNSFPDDNEAKTRLHELYKVTSNKLIREEIARKLGINENAAAFKGEKQFLFAVRRNIKEPQERVFSLAFENCNLKYKSGLKADFDSYTYLLQVFKNDKNLLNLHKFVSLKDVFDNESLQEFVLQLFSVLKRKDDIKSAKWLVRMVCLLLDDEQKLINFLFELFDEKRIKEAKYLFECLVASKKQGVVLQIKQLEKNESFAMEVDYYINLISEFLGFDKAVLKDALIKETDSEEDIKKRMFEEFISGRVFSQSYFKTYISLPIVSKLCEKLVFGQYKFGRLYSAFVVENQNFKFIKGEYTSDSYISVIHLQDIDDRFESILTYFSNPTFNQFEKSEFKTSDFELTLAKISSFYGMIVELQTFLSGLEKFGFVANKEFSDDYFTSIISVFEPLNIVCEVEFEKKITSKMDYATLSNIHFYKHSQLVTSNGKYLTQKQNALTIKNLPYRYFAFIMNKILSCVKV